MPQIDIGAVLKAKAPRLARWIPRPAVGWLRRTIHEKEINHILQHYWSLPPQEFIRACFRQWQVSYSIEGLEGLDPVVCFFFVLFFFFFVFVCLLSVNKHGAQNAAYARKMEEEFFGERQILTFPAGLCSRRIDGCVADPEWKISFLKKAYASQRQIVPVFVEGRLSNFFYRIDRLRKRLGIKFNIEMLWLPDEMFSQQGKHFRIVVGDPISMAELQSAGSLREQAEYVRKIAYFLEKKLSSATQ